VQVCIAGLSSDASVDWNKLCLWVKRQSLVLWLSACPPSIVFSPAPEWLCHFIRVRYDSPPHFIFSHRWHHFISCFESDNWHCGTDFIVL